MSVLSKLTKRNLNLNKKRTIVTIIGIILSTALIVCVSGMVTSFQQTLVNMTIEDEGNYHVLIENMNREDTLSLYENRNIEDFYYMNHIGYAKFDASLNEHKSYMYLKAFSEKALQNLGIKLVEGRLPENSNEIVIPEHLINEGGFSKKVGDEISLEIGNRYLMEEEKYILNQSNPLTVDDNNITVENFEGVYEQTYKIVGIIERISYIIEDYTAPGYTCITYTDEILENQDVAILYKNAKDYNENTNQIAADKYDVIYHSELLRWLGVIDSGTMRVLYVVAFVVILIIIISSVFVIKNSFAISITEKFKMYGMLRSVGATSKQIRKNVLYEGFLLGLIAIPIGVLLGILAIVILVFLLNLILGDYLYGIKFVYSIPVAPILLSIVLASLTIYFSTIFSSIRASKISAIEAIRSNNDIKIKSKKLKTPKIIKKVFKTGGVIAYKNLKRNKKKYRTTVISIVVSVFVFISLSSFIDFGFKMAGLYYRELDYNMIVYNRNNDLEKEKIMTNKITGFKEVESYSYIRYAGLNWDSGKYLSDYGNEIMDTYNNEFSDSQLTVVSLGEEEYARFTEKLGLSSNVNYGILIDKYVETINKKKYMGNLYNLKDHDTLKVTTNTDQKLTLEVMRMNDSPMGLEYAYFMEGYLIVSDKIMDEFFETTGSSIYLNTSDTSKMKQNLDTLSKENEDYSDLTYENFEDYINQMNAMVLVISIFLYGFITVISLIGITNIFNTITTNMNLRSKEFAMLKSIGMTKREFNRMIRLESIFYGFKSLFIGIPLGISGSYLIYLAFKGGLEFSYRPPYIAILISILFVSFIISIIMKFSLNKINKQNIIETIRNDNI